MGKFNFKTDDLVWRANFYDGTELWERDPKTRQEHKFSEIDQSKLKSFDLLLPIKDMEDVKLSETDIQVKTLDDTAAIVSLKVYSKHSIPFYHLELQKEQRIIFARRRQMQSGRKMAIIPTKSGEIRIPFPVPSGQRIIIIGWQRKIGKENVQSICFIFPDGRIEMAGAWGEDATYKEVNMNIVDESKITLDLKETSISADAKLTKK